MKRIIAVLCSAVLFCSAANAQGGLLGALKGAAQNAVSGVLTNAGINVVDLAGTWTYQGVATEFTGTNTLTTIAAGAATSTVEGKIDAALTKVGIKPGIASFTFGRDYNFTVDASGKKVAGTWSQEGTTLTLKFGKKFTYLTMSGNITPTSNGCQVVFEASKYLTFIEKVMTVLGNVSSSSTVSAISSAMNNVTGMKVGFKLSR